MNPGFYGLFIALGFVLLGVIVFLIRKYVPGIKGEDDSENKTDKEKAEENLKNKIVEFKAEDEENKDEE